MNLRIVRSFEWLSHFFSKGQPLSLNVVTHDIGNNLRIKGKVGKRSQKGLFELWLHGWNHINYTILSESEQRSPLKEANEKMNRMFDDSSDIFVPLHILITKRSMHLKS
jgi:hypothetical protein